MERSHESQVETDVYLAHSSNDDGTSDALEKHLQEVAALTRNFADEMSAPTWGQIAGLWHDLGKYSDAFQRYIRSLDSGGDLQTSPDQRVDHSTYGAQHAGQSLDSFLGEVLAFCIAGHHAGLTNAKGDERSSLRSRLRKLKSSPEPLETVLERVPDEIRMPRPDIASILKAELSSRELALDPELLGFQLAVFCRLLFSCLVDADFLATEQHFSVDKPMLRTGGAAGAMPGMSELSACLTNHLTTLDGRATTASHSVNALRSQVLRDCRAAASRPPGCFSLTVPTGGGKTLSSLAFALDHAVANGRRRVIYAIPYTSIIEQTAGAFRDVFAGLGQEVLIEHHNNLDPDSQSRWSELASENWDAPLIVTTNVQLFESLFARRTSRCRKLHRIANSVIVLDEAQSIPVTTLQPCLAILRELVLNYGCSIVLCTATQPAFARQDGFEIGLDDIDEIIGDVPELFEGMTRTKIEISDRAKCDNIWVVEQMMEHEQALCIVNTRAHAAALFTLLREQVVTGVYHLSSRMCAEHRSDVLQSVREALNKGRTCLLVSTQVVEAGVDIDFPFVLRAMAGLDSIAQAAGRCNRGGQEEIRRVVVFETDVKPPHEITMSADDARSVLPEHSDDVLSPEAIKAYFDLHYWKRSTQWDTHGVMAKSVAAADGGMLVKFRDIAAEFRMIDDGQQAIFIPYGDRGRELVEALTNSQERPKRPLLRKLQRFTVNVYERDLLTLRENHVVIEPHEGMYVLVNYADGYCGNLGLVTGAVSTGFMNV